MRAYQIESYTGPGGLRLVERPEPKPGFGQVLIRIHATSLNYRDLIVVNGQYGHSQRPHLIPVSDGAGEVVEVGVVSPVSKLVTVSWEFFCRRGSVARLRLRR
jgi:NADPH:quinone reductase-like Zn-dependent oxidoreductase